MSTCADVGSFIESKTSVVQTSNVSSTSEVSDYLVVHMGPGDSMANLQNVSIILLCLLGLANNDSQLSTHTHTLSCSPSLFLSCTCVCTHTHTHKHTPSHIHIHSWDFDNNWMLTVEVLFAAVQVSDEWIHQVFNTWRLSKHTCTTTNRDSNMRAELSDFSVTTYVMCLKGWQWAFTSL